MLSINPNWSGTSCRFGSASYTLISSASAIPAVSSCWKSRPNSRFAVLDSIGLGSIKGGRGTTCASSGRFSSESSESLDVGGRELLPRSLSWCSRVGVTWVPRRGDSGNVYSSGLPLADTTDSVSGVVSKVCPGVLRPLFAYG